MKNLLRSSVLLFSLCVSICGYAQGVSSSGTEFWLGFMPNGQPMSSPMQLSLFLASETNNEVTVTVHDSSRTVFIAPGQTSDLSLDQNAVTTQADSPTTNAIHVTSKNPITIYGYSTWTCTSCIGKSPDGYLGLPITAYGTKYYTMNFPDGSAFSSNGGLRKGEFLIVAPYDQTQITITPAAATSTGHAAHAPYTVSLNRGQTYLVQSSGTQSGSNDLTGSLITSTKPVAVLTGHEISAVPSGGSSADHLIEMMPSIDKWGEIYYDVPMTGRTKCGDFVRLLSAEDGNQITSSKNPVVLNAGEYVDREFVMAPEVFRSTNSKKFIATVYSYSQGTNGDQAQADPFMTILPTQQQFENVMMFRTPSTKSGLFKNYVTFISSYDALNKITINGQPITRYQSAGTTSFPATNPQVGAYRVVLPSTPQAYFASSSTPFGAYQYGNSTYESYGWPASMGQRIILADTLPPLASIVDNSCGTYRLRFYEPRTRSNSSFDDTRLASIAMVTDTGDSRWPKPSFNFSFTANPNFMVGDSAASATLTVIDRARESYAAIYVTDRAGNDTVYQYYYGSHLETVPATPYNFMPVLVDADSCLTITLKDTQYSVFLGDSLFFKRAAAIGDFTVSPNKPFTLLHDSSVSLTVCFHPTDTLLAADTLSLGLCTGFSIPLTGRGVTPLIYAKDQNFGEVSIGDTLCKDVEITNPGQAPLLVTGQDFIQDENFSVGTDHFPLVVPIGGSTTIHYCFHPQREGRFSKHVIFFNGNPTRFQHSIKDTLLLIGTSGNASVNNRTEVLAFDRAFPNPFQGAVTIRYSLKEARRVIARVFDLTGREVRTISSRDVKAAGIHDLQLDLYSLPDGVYVCSLSSYDANGAVDSTNPILITKE